MTLRIPNARSEAADRDASDWGFEGARRFQAQLGLALSPAERLQWLEETVAEMRELCGRARLGHPVGAQKLRED
jgi:hypothetical protein